MVFRSDRSMAASQLCILLKCEHVDAVCDVYIGKRSLKTRCRARHGGAASQRTCVDSDKPISKGAAWHTFLLDSETKQQLLEYISEEIRNAT